MKRRFFAVLPLTLALGCHAQAPGAPSAPGAHDAGPDAPAVMSSPADVPRPPYRFAPDDEKLLDEIQHASFLSFWNDGNAPLHLMPDRSSGPLVSTAAVGFQLSALVVGAERGWVTRERAAERALTILKALDSTPENRRYGLFYHYLDAKTAGQHDARMEHAVSTVDSAILFAGILTASSYFGGEVRALGDRLFAEADWKAFVSTPDTPKIKPWEVGFISLAWKPKDPKKPNADGDFVPYYWLDSADEHRLVTFLSICAPRDAHRPDPRTYYRLRRGLGTYGNLGPMAWFPYSGALFTAFFAHCWIDYAAIGPDDPAAHGVERRARVDWWENSRRLALMQRAKCAANPKGLATLGPDSWGLSASDAPGGYAVPGLFPDPLPMPGARANFDFPPEKGRDDYADGTIAPYAAGSCIMFTPTESLAALRHYRDLTGPDGRPLVWQGPSEGGRGFRDAFNLSGPAPWVASDYLGIDQGPLLLAIENARTGLIWKTFSAHPAVRAGLARLGLERIPRGPAK